MTLYQLNDGYCYNSDSILLADFALSHLPIKHKNGIDIGAGCGILGAILSRDSYSMTLVEIDPYMSYLARQNLYINRLKARVLNLDFASFSSTTKFDFAIFNPPFYHQDCLNGQNARKNIARFANNLPLDTILSTLRSVLLPQGRIVFCYDASQIDEVLSLLRIHHFGDIRLQFVHPKPENKANLALIHARFLNKGKSQILPPLFMFLDERLNPYISALYAKFNLHSIKVNSSDITLPITKPDFDFSFDPIACESCGAKCCSGASGYVFASIAEIEEIASFLRLPFDSFTMQFLKKVNYKFSFIEKLVNGNYECIFLDSTSRRCSIYPVRPTQCRSFPFWDTYRDKRNLETLQTECIGIKRSNL